MATGDPTIGFGATAEVDDSGGSFAQLDAIVACGIPTITTGTVDSKRLSADMIKTLATVNKGDSFSIKFEHTHAGFARAKALQDRESHRFRFTIPDDEGETVIIGPCIVTQVKHADLESDKITEYDMQLQVADAFE